MTNHLKTVKHVVHLMLENRSFDQMLGFLYGGKRTTPDGQPFEGLTGAESNPDGHGRLVPIRKITAATPHPYLRPGADPGEGFFNTNLQLFSQRHSVQTVIATNQGFVINFQAAIAFDASRGYKDSIPGTVPEDIMEAYAPEMLPVMSALATSYAVCDHWFASAPTQTIPNRAFAAAGTSQGHLDNQVKVFTCPSIYGRMTDAGVSWMIFGYTHAPLTRLDFPDTLSADPSHYGRFADFQRLAAAGTLPAYSFLEPDFGAAGNSQHPNYDVSKGERLLLDVYRALRDGPGWKDTLLIITYDEHGGNYDHVIPPTTAVPPDATPGEFDNFTFQRLGVRVPALLISPRIKAGTVFRASKGVIDHTSVLKTIADRWKLPSLTARDKAAAGLGNVLTLAKPRTDDPLATVHAPASNAQQPNLTAPSELERIYAWRLSQLPIPNAVGGFEHLVPPLETSSEMAAYIDERNAEWDRHISALNAQ